MPGWTAARSRHELMARDPSCRYAPSSCPRCEMLGVLPGLCLQPLPVGRRSCWCSHQTLRMSVQCCCLNSLVVLVCAECPHSMGPNTCLCSPGLNAERAALGPQLFKGALMACLKLLFVFSGSFTYPLAEDCGLFPMELMRFQFTWDTLGELRLCLVLGGSC